MSVSCSSGLFQNVARRFSFSVFQLILTRKCIRICFIKVFPNQPHMRFPRTIHNKKTQIDCLLILTRYMVKSVTCQAADLYSGDDNTRICSSYFLYRWLTLISTITLPWGDALFELSGQLAMGAGRCGSSTKPSMYRYIHLPSITSVYASTLAFFRLFSVLKQRYKNAMIEFIHDLYSVGQNNILAKILPNQAFL